MIDAAPNLLDGGVIQSNGGTANTSGNLSLQSTDGTDGKLFVRQSDGTPKVTLSPNGDIDLGGNLSLTNSTTNKNIQLLGNGSSSKLRVQIGQTTDSLVERFKVLEEIRKYSNHELQKISELYSHQVIQFYRSWGTSRQKFTTTDLRNAKLKEDASNGQGAFGS